MIGFPLEDVYWHTTSRMHKQGMRALVADRISYQTNGIILHRQNVNIGLFVDFIEIRRVITVQSACQLLGMILCTTIDLDDFLACCFQGEGEVCGQIA